MESGARLPPTVSRRRPPPSPDATRPSPPPHPSPSSRARDGRRGVSLLVSLLACCAALCVILTVHLHARLHVVLNAPSSGNGGMAAGEANRIGVPPEPERRRPGRDVSRPEKERKGGGGEGGSAVGDNGGNSARGDAAPAGGGAACLLVNDENPRLPEWLAYHYHVLPLRHLTVAVDPASRSSPAEILGRWEGLIDVRVWGEEDYLPESDGRGRIGRGPCDPGDAKVRGREVGELVMET